MFVLVAGESITPLEMLGAVRFLMLADSLIRGNRSNFTTGNLHHRKQLVLFSFPGGIDKHTHIWGLIRMGPISDTKD